MRQMWKGMLMGLVTALAVGGLATGARADATCGDLNNSGGRTIADVVLLFRAVVENPDPPGLCGNATTGALQCGDVNADGAIAIADVVILFNAVLGNETLFPLCTGQGNSIACPGGTATVSTDVTQNQVWPNTCTILLDGTIFVQPNVVLTIQAGTTIKGKKVSGNGSPSALVFRRDSKINAQGTSASPIVFTSDQSPGSRSKGDWGGLVLNGRAPVNVPGGEGLAEGLNNVPFGGNEANDSSGILRFLRVEFAGKTVGPDNELNVVTHNGVGKGTTEDHIQANVGLDDGLEWFGGTVNSKFMVSTGAADDNFDWQLGTTGALQFGYAQQTGGSIDAAGSNGFEGDNNENNFELTPRSFPKFCNVTLIGCKGQAGCNVSAVGALLRRGTDGTIANTLVQNFNTGGIQLRDASTATQACDPGPTLTGNLIIQNSIFFDNGPTGVEHCVGHSSTSGANCSSCTLYDLYANSKGVRPDLSPPGAAVDPGISDSYPNADPRPTNVAAVTTGVADCTTIDDSFQSTNYIGAFDPNGSNWLTTPWISFATQ